MMGPKYAANARRVIAEVKKVRVDYPKLKSIGDKGNSVLVPQCIDEAGICFLARKCFENDQDRPLIDLGCSVGSALLLVLQLGGRVGGCDLQPELILNFRQIASNMGFEPERLTHVIHRNMESYPCPFAVPPVVWICNVNFTHRSIIVLAQLVTYPVGTDIYTAAALPCINGRRGLSTFVNNEGSRKVAFVEKLVDVCSVPWSKQPLSVYHYQVQYHEGNDEWVNLLRDLREAVAKVAAAKRTMEVAEDALQGVIRTCERHLG